MEKLYFGLTFFAVCRRSPRIFFCFSSSLFLSRSVSKKKKKKCFLIPSKTVCFVSPFLWKFLPVAAFYWWEREFSCGLRWKKKKRERVLFAHFSSHVARPNISLWASKWATTARKKVRKKETTDKSSIRNDKPNSLLEQKNLDRFERVLEASTFRCAFPQTSLTTIHLPLPPKIQRKNKSKKAIVVQRSAATHTSKLLNWSGKHRGEKSTIIFTSLFFWEILFFPLFSFFFMQLGTELFFSAHKWAPRQWYQYEGDISCRKTPEATYTPKMFFTSYSHIFACFRGVFRS